MRTRSIALAAALAASFTAGCATAPAGDAAPMPAQAAAPAAAPAPATAPAPASTATAKLDPDQVVCRTYESTGSRLRQTRICKTRAEWEEESRRAQEWVQGVDRATQPGGESLPGR